MAGCFVAFAASKKDPVLMKVNGKPVTLSEFEYMYHKNNQQQVAQQPLEKYVDMFTTYKLKVADAEAAGIDTTQAFIKEYEGYRNELAMPYLRDTVAEENMRKMLYERMKTNVLASHIMLPMGKTAEENATNKARLDSLRSCILAGQPFDSLAIKYSVDRSALQNGGSMGYVSVGRFPYQFEDACYNTPVGTVSEPFTTDFGWHIVKTFDVRPDEGEVLVEHILKLYPRNATAEQKAEVKHVMDSIYSVVKGGAEFEKVAMKESEDPGSAKQGGKLPYFGHGRMVPQFDEVSFKLAKGEISEPFETQYGIHIVKKLDTRSVGDYASVRDQLTGLVGMRGNIAVDSKIEQLLKQYKLSENDKLIKRLKAEVTLPDSLDDKFIDKYLNSNEQLFTLAGNKYPLSELISRMGRPGRMTGEQAYRFIDARLKDTEREVVLEYEKQQLEKNNKDFGNLVREYRDGMLLFEVSNRNVWQKAQTDTEGLKAYFEAHRSEYKWDAPKYKGYLVETTGDSITRIAKQRIAELGSDTIVTALRKELGKNLKVVRVLAAKGENAKVDSEMFGGEKVVAKEKDKYKDYFVFGGKLVAKPEEVGDVRGQVVADYQSYLEKQWDAELHKKYPVEIDKKVLKQVK